MSSPALLGTDRHAQNSAKGSLTMPCDLQPEPEPEPEDEPMDEEEAAARERKAAAQKEKEAGNAAYKARKFEEAVAHYDKAIELDETDISFLTNRCGLLQVSFFISLITVDLDPSLGARRGQIGPGREYFIAGFQSLDIAVFRHMGFWDKLPER